MLLESMTGINILIASSSKPRKKPLTREQHNRRLHKEQSLSSILIVQPAAETHGILPYVIETTAADFGSLAIVQTPRDLRADDADSTRTG
jgi:hypothetical protein